MLPATAAGTAEAARQLGGAHPARQLEQRERVAARLGDDPVARRARRAGPGRRVASSARASSSSSPSQRQLRQARQLALIARLAHGEDERHRLRQQPARDEPEHLRGGVVEPLAVVHDAQQRLLLRQRPQAGRAWPARRGSGPAHRRSARPSATRSASLLRPGSTSSRSSSGAHSWCRPAYGSSISDSTPAICATRKPDAAGGVTQQRGLADAGLAADDEHAAAPAARVLEQPVQPRALAGPAAEPRRALGGHAGPNGTGEKATSAQNFAAATGHGRGARPRPPRTERGDEFHANPNRRQRDGQGGRERRVDGGDRGYRKVAKPHVTRRPVTSTGAMRGHQRDT